MPSLPPLRIGRPRCERSTIKLDAELELPFGIVEGAKDGPCLLVTAGIHGSEFCSIEAAQRLLGTDPSSLSGTLLVLPIVNLAAFWKRSIYVVPADGKNLNRVFPGRADGSASERLAHWLVGEAFAKADAYVDLHGGDLNEALIPFSLFREGDARSEALARSFGLPIGIASRYEGFTVAAAAMRGVPSIIAEVSGNGLWDDASVSELSQGLKRVMHGLGMIAETPPLAPSMALMTLTVVASASRGLWYPYQRLGAPVAMDQAVGEIRNLRGERESLVTSPVPGRVLFQMTSLSVNEGEALLGVATDRPG
ncbi:MAG: succinylglutamate desuccinylase/aspartoacylase family protein [Hyphomicrobiales bacterium]